MAVAIVVLPADTAGQISNFIDVFVSVYIMILAYILSSWFRLPYSRG